MVRVFESQLVHARYVMFLQDLGGHLKTLFH